MVFGLIGGGVIGAMMSYAGVTKATLGLSVLSSASSARTTYKQNKSISGLYKKVEELFSKIQELRNGQEHLEKCFQEAMKHLKKLESRIENLEAGQDDHANRLRNLERAGVSLIAVALIVTSIYKWNWIPDKCWDVALTVSTPMMTAYAMIHYDVCKRKPLSADLSTGSTTGKSEGVDHKKIILEYEEGLARIRKLPEGDDFEIVNYLNAIGLVWYSIGDYQQAIDLFEESWAILKSLPKRENERQIFTTLSLLGRTYCKLEINEKAIESYGEFLKLGGGRDNNEETATVLSNLSYAYRELKNYREASRYSEKVVEVQKTIYKGEKRLHIANELDVLGWISLELENYKKAMEYYQESLEIRKEVYQGGKHEQIALSFENLGRVWLGLGSSRSRTIEYFEGCYELRIEVLGLNHPETQKTKQNLKSLREQSECIIA